MRLNCVVRLLERMTTENKLNTAKHRRFTPIKVIKISNIFSIDSIKFCKKYNAMNIKYDAI